jgi:hypothetical protein
MRHCIAWILFTKKDASSSQRCVFVDVCVCVCVCARACACVRIRREVIVLSHNLSRAHSAMSKSKRKNIHSNQH